MRTGFEHGTWADSIARAIRPPLPGPGAASRMLPVRRGTAEDVPDPVFRDAAVLVLLYPAGGSIRFPLIRRTGTSRRHPGQMALPGGSREPGEHLILTALRETGEELGIPVPESAVLGALSPVAIRRSGYLVHPFVAALDREPRFSPCPGEVETVFGIAIDDLLDPLNERIEATPESREFVAIPSYDLGGSKVWGATAMMLAELSACLRRVR